MAVGALHACGVNVADERVEANPKMALELVYGADLIILLFV